MFNTQKTWRFSWASPTILVLCLVAVGCSSKFSRKAWKNPDPQLIQGQRQALGSLAIAADKNDIPKLIETLGDDDLIMRYWARKALKLRAGGADYGYDQKAWQKAKLVPLPPLGEYSEWRKRQVLQGKE